MRCGQQEPTQTAHPSAHQHPAMLNAIATGRRSPAEALMVHRVQIWVGSKQKQLQLGSMQLMHEYVPQATLMLAVLVPLLEPMGLKTAAPGVLSSHSCPGNRVPAAGPARRAASTVQLCPGNTAELQQPCSRAAQPRRHR